MDKNIIKIKKGYRSIEDINFILGVMSIFLGYNLTSQLCGVFVCILSMLLSFFLANYRKDSLIILGLNILITLIVSIALYAHIFG